MLKFFGIGKEKAKAVAQVDPASSLVPDSSLHTNTQRELVRVVLKDTLRTYNIPPGSVGCEVIVVPRPNTAGQWIVHLTVLKWHEGLLRYAPALQQELIKNLNRFNPAVNHASYIFAWRFADDCGCPFTQMPEPGFWTTAVAAKPVVSPTAQVSPVDPKSKFDLPELDVDQDNPASEFAATQIGSRF